MLTLYASKCQYIRIRQFMRENGIKAKMKDLVCMDAYEVDTEDNYNKLKSFVDGLK